MSVLHTLELACPFPLPAPPHPSLKCDESRSCFFWAQICDTSPARGPPAGPATLCPANMRARCAAHVRSFVAGSISWIAKVDARCPATLFPVRPKGVG
jgi:hypothetical protein